MRAPLWFHSRRGRPTVSGAALVALLSFSLGGCGLVLDLDSEDQKERDAGIEASIDGKTKNDGNTEDGGSGKDAAPPGGSSDSGDGSTGEPSCLDDSEACDDGVECTVDSCRDGVCRHELDDAVCIIEDDDLRCTTDGCRVPSCILGENCVPGPCQTASCDGDLCLIESRCAAGEECCADACVPVGCDDDNPCTTDSCEDDDGCANEPVPSDIACDNGIFCDGLDACVDGMCVPYRTSPCEPGVCDETNRTCNECVSDDDCPSPVTGPLSACLAQDGTCTTIGIQQRNITSFRCTQNRCVSVLTTMTTECTVDTDGEPCSDGLYCNGEEVCSGGSCAPGQPPCSTMSTCHETLRTCVGSTFACDAALDCSRPCGQLQCPGGACGCVDGQCGCSPEGV